MALELNSKDARPRKFSYDLADSNFVVPALVTKDSLREPKLTVPVTDSHRFQSSNLDYERVALALSVFGHLIVFYLAIFGFPNTQSVPKNVIYSVSIEGSTKLGGVQQVAKGKQDTPIAPPKKVSAPEPKKVEPQSKVEPVKKVVPPVVPKEKAEISLKEKEKAKPKTTPAPDKAKVQAKAKPEPVKAVPPVKSESKAKPVDTKAEANKNFEQALQRYLGESTNAGGVGFGGDGRGGRAMGGGVVKPPEWFLYKDLLESTIKRGWNWHDNSAALIASVAFRISERGEISDVQLVHGSGNSYYDESIIRAVKKATPVPAPPPQFYNDFRFVELDFKPQ